MPRLDQLEELDVALKTAAKEADPKTASRQVAEEFYDSHRKLIEPLIAEWVVEKIAGLIGKLRAKKRRESNRQLVFQAKLGFAHIPQTVDLGSGQVIATGEATRKVFRKLKVQLRKAKIRSLEPIMEEIKRADALFARYTRSKKTEHITWAEIVEKEAEKAIQQGLFDWPERD